MLTNLGVEANGFVTLAPRHSVWYATPGEDISSVSDWWMLLARHEARHMAQFDAADQGTTRALHILFGELGWGAGIVLGTPPWLLEGDAVAMETALSEEGRGRDPLFTMEVTAMVSENEDSSYFSAVNPSYKVHVPDYYRVGYSLASWIRQEYGSDALEEIYRSAARIPIPVIGLNTGSKRSTGKKPKDLYKELAISLSRAASALYEQTTWTPAQIVTPEADSFTRYDALFDVGDGLVFARKQAMAEAPYLVQIDSSGADGIEKRIFRLPSGGRVSLADVNGDGQNGTRIRVAWNSIRQHPVYTGSSVSDITVVNLDSRNRVISRKVIVSGSRLLYPALSPDGSLIAAVDILEGGGSNLVLLDAETGDIVVEIPVNRTGIPETAAYPSWAPKGDRLVFSLRNDGGRRIAEWEIGTSEIIELTPLSLATVKKPVYSIDGQVVYFSSNKSGTEAIWAVDRSGGDPLLLAQRWYGAYNPIASRDGSAVYAVEYASSAGEAVSRIDLRQNATPATPESSTSLPAPRGLTGEYESYIVEENPRATERDFRIRNPEERAAVVSAGNREYPEFDYKISENAFNLHSWGFSFGLSTGNFVGNELVLNIQSRDVLSTTAFEAGFLYEITESSPGVYADLSFTGLRPVIGIRGEYRYRSPKTDPFHQTSFLLTALYPANLGRTGIWNHNLDIGIAGGLLSYYPSDHSPYLSYTADWSRLRPGSARAFRPDLGWDLRADYSMIPLPEEYGDSASAELDLFFPGGFKNTSLSLGGGIEYRRANFVPQITQPRGYDWENPNLTVLGSVDYEFPLGYPDLPLGSVIFVQRFRLGLFSDFGFIGDSFSQRWSTGATLTMDFAAFNSFSGLSLGIQFSWRWQDNTPRIEFMILELPVF